MDHSEKVFFQYLKSRGFINIVYEPDGNIPPDFTIDGQIAVEVRRLNENEKTTTGHRGLEEVSKPLTALIEKALVATGPPHVWGKLVRLVFLSPSTTALAKTRYSSSERTARDQGATRTRDAYVLQIHCESASLVQPNSIRICSSSVAGRITIRVASSFQTCAKHSNLHG